MSTRSRIGMDIGNNQARTIYCHYDGYPGRVGKTLVEHYKDADKVSELINLGDLSSLGEEVNPINPNHSYNNPEPNVCIAYGRDRGETGSDSIVLIADGKFWGVSTEDFNYLFRDGKWYYRGYSNSKWILLK